MRVNYYIFPDEMPQDKLLELAFVYGLDITLDIPKATIKQMMFDDGYIDSIDEPVKDEWLVFTVNGAHPNAANTLAKYKQYPVKEISKKVEGLKVTEAKKLLKNYGGHAYSEFFNRGNGEFYGCTPIELTGRNTKVGYKVK